MKIALIGRFGESEIVAGPERVARELFAELKGNNIDVIFIEYFFSGYRNSSLYKKIFGKEFLNDYTIVRLGILPLISKLLKEQYDIIHLINLQRFVLFILLVKVFIKSKFIVTFHGLLKYEIPRKDIWLKRYFIDFLIEKLAVYKSKLLVFPSYLLFDAFTHHYDISEREYKIIPNGISEVFNNKAVSFSKIEDSMKFVFYNGFICSINKGLNELLHILKDIKNKIELFITGNNPLISSLGNIKIIFAGQKNHNELINFLSDKHFVIKSMAFDSFSIFTAECMTLGLIPIINDKTGIKDYIDNGSNGFIYNSESDLVRLLNDISDNRFDLSLISCNAKKIYEKLNWGKVAKEYIVAYQNLI